MILSSLLKMLSMKGEFVVNNLLDHNSSSVLESVLEYQRLKWPVLPIHTVVNKVCSCGKDGCANAGKHPRTFKGLYDATCDSDKLNQYYSMWPDANIGIRTGARAGGSGFFVLDIDPRNGGDKSFETLIDRHGSLPDTVCVETGGDGQHYYFACPSSYKLKGKSNLLPGIDIKAENGYVIAPSSKHLSGGTYRWREGCSPSETMPAAPPIWLLELLGVSKGEESIELFFEGNVTGADRSDECFESMRKIKVDDQNDGSKRLYTVACRCVEHGLNDQKSVLLIHRYKIERPFPKIWTDDEILQRISHARSNLGVASTANGICGVKNSKSDSKPDLHPYIPFPVEILPSIVRQYINECALAIGCDPSFIALPLLVGFASAIGDSRCIRLKRIWCEPAILWGAIVAESGASKSPAINQALLAVKKKQAKAMAEHKRKMKTYNSETSKFNPKTGELKNQYKQDESLVKLEMPQKPICKRYTTDDVTVEALVGLLNENPRGLLMIRDELSGWMDFDRYSGGSGGVSGNAAKWLEMYGGRNMIVDRKGSGNQSVERAHVSVIGGIQPGVLRRGLGQANKENGLAARILLVMPPDRLKVWGEIDLDQELEHSIASVFECLYGLVPLKGDHENRIAQEVGLTAEAKAAFVKYHDEHNLEMSGLSSDLKAVWSKLEGGAARLALVIHMVRGAIAEMAGDESFDHHNADEESMLIGVQLARWFSNEARRVYAVLGENDGQQRVRKLIEAIERKGSRVSVREWQRSRSLKASLDAELQLDELVELGLGRWEDPAKDSKGGRPTKIFVLCAISGS